jgi:hypothetical protein
MDNPELCELLEQLQREIEETETVDEKELELLRDLGTDIHELLERCQAEQVQTQPLNDPAMGRCHRIPGGQPSHPDGHDLKHIKNPEQCRDLNINASPPLNEEGQGGENLRLLGLLGCGGYG